MSRLVLRNFNFYGNETLRKTEKMHCEGRTVFTEFLWAISEIMKILPELANKMETS